MKLQFFQRTRSLRGGRLFYDRVIEIESIWAELDGMELDEGQKEELREIIDDILRHKIMDRILETLPEDHHEEFLELVHKRPHDEGIVDYLKEKIEDIEDRLKLAAREFKTELAKELSS